MQSFRSGKHALKPNYEFPDMSINRGSSTECLHLSVVETVFSILKYNLSQDQSSVIAFSRYDRFQTCHKITIVPGYTQTIASQIIAFFSEERSLLRISPSTTKNDRFRIAYEKTIASAYIDFPQVIHCYSVATLLWATL